MKSVGYGAGYRYVHNDAQAKGRMECLRRITRAAFICRRGKRKELSAKS